MKQTIILNQNRDFQTLYKRGISFVTPFVVIYMRPNRFGVHRLGITAGKRVGNAVQRNRAKRLIRQAYRELEAELPPYLDIVIVARARICNLTSTRLVKYLRKETIPQIQRHWEPPIRMRAENPPSRRKHRNENPAAAVDSLLSEGAFPFKKAMLPLLSDLQCLCVAGGQTVWGMAWNGSGSSPDSAV